MNTKQLVINCLGASNTRILIDTNGVARTDINYPTFLAEILGCTVRNYGVSGTNIAKQEGRTDSYVERAEEMETDADVIIIQGGGNDASHGLPLGDADSMDPYTYCGALHTLIENVKRANPNARLLLSTAMRKKQEPQNRTDGLTHFDFYQAFVAVCKKQGVACIDFYKDPILDPLDTQRMPDGLHMSETACNYMAQVFADEIQSKL